MILWWRHVAFPFYDLNIFCYAFDQPITITRGKQSLSRYIECQHAVHSTLCSWLLVSLFGLSLPLSMCQQGLQACGLPPTVIKTISVSTENMAFSHFMVVNNSSGFSRVGKAQTYWPDVSHAPVVSFHRHKHLLPGQARVIHTILTWSIRAIMQDARYGYLANSLLFVKHHLLEIPTAGSWKQTVSLIRAGELRWGATSLSPCLGLTDMNCVLYRCGLDTDGPAQRLYFYRGWRWGGGGQHAKNQAMTNHGV